MTEGGNKGDFQGTGVVIWMLGMVICVWKIQLARTVRTNVRTNVRTVHFSICVLKIFSFKEYKSHPLREAVMSSVGS